MKRKLVVSLLLLAFTGLVAVPAFAATDPVSDAKAWFEQKFSAKKAWVDQAVKDGRLTPEQGQAMKEHFDQMYEFHEQNGFVCPNGGPGMGRGMGNGMGRQGGFGAGFGRWGGQAPAAPNTAPGA
ncbi:MAG: DUF2680 domain-containing protein [Bacillota bacterium]|nr:DUF2680 domain-containing protein [Bacillota bacterium]